VTIKRVIPIWIKERVKDFTYVFFNIIKPYFPEFKDKMI